MAAYKLLPYFLFPTTWVILLMLAGLILLWRRSTTKAAAALFAALALICVFGNPRVSSFLLGSLEAFYPPQAIEALPQADAIVLLGGGVDLAAPPRLEPDLNESADRLWYAAKLYHAGKAPWIIVSGGQVFPQPGLKTEAEYHVDLLLQLGVPRDAILLETRSRNTEENALFTAQLMRERLPQNASAETPQPKVLLTTSAAHQPRAMLLFAKSGLVPIAASCDVQVARLQQPWLLEVLPSASALSASEGAIREWIGFLSYRLIDRRLLDLLRS
jgi:uncharacterized SAM-binding protein YcdF (DUF218 family)